MRELGSVRNLGHLPVVLEHIVLVDYWMHLTWHAHNWTCHLRSHLPTLMASLGHLVLLKAIHMGHVHHRLIPYFVVSMSKRASVLIRTLATFSIIFANVAFIICLIDTYLFITPHLRRLRHLLIHLWVHSRLLETVGLLAHRHTLGSTVASTALLHIVAAKIIVFVVAASEIWLLAWHPVLEPASARQATTHTAALIAWTTSGHTAT